MALKVCSNFNFYSSYLLPPFFTVVHVHMHTHIRIFTAFPNSHGIYRVAILFVMEKSKRIDEQVARGTMLRNFWQTFYGKMKSIRLSLVSAVVKASLLLRCGDVEMNPGPVGDFGKVHV